MLVRQAHARAPRTCCPTHPDSHTLRLPPHPLFHFNSLPVHRRRFVLIRTPVPIFLPRIHPTFPGCGLHLFGQAGILTYVIILTEHLYLLFFI